MAKQNNKRYTSSFNSNIFSKDTSRSQKPISSNNNTFSDNVNYPNSSSTTDYMMIASFMNRLDSLEKENNYLQRTIKEMKHRENKLLNRFSWLIFIMNIVSTVLLLFAIILFIDAFYPFVKKLMDNSTGATFVIGTIGATIGGGIIALWCKFNSYVKFIMDREKK